MVSPTGDDRERKRGWAVAIVKFLVLGLSMAGLGALAFRYNVKVEDLRDLLKDIPSAVKFPAFIGLYTLVSVAPVPARDVAKVTGAILFGGMGSVFLIYIGELCAVSVAWVLARFLGKDLVDRLLEGRLVAFQKKIEGANWWQVALLRIFPGTPYRFFNFAAPLTSIRLGPYVLGCVIGTFPRTLVFQLFFGYAGGTLIDYEITTFQIFVASIAFAVIAIVFWAAYAQFAKMRARRAK